MHAALLALVFLTLAGSAAAETYDGSRVIIVDGDTFGFGLERFRILNIDTPESFRPRCEAELVLGLKAKERLASLLRAGRVTIHREGKDRYGRALVRVWVRGRDVGETLVRAVSPYPGTRAPQLVRSA
jgi:endonuclease YncB( thermonuclease family)